MVEISKAALVKSEQIAKEKLHPRATHSSFGQISPDKSSSQKNEQESGSRGSRQYINPRGRSRDGSFGRKLLNNTQGQNLGSSNRSLNNFYKRASSKSPSANPTVIDQGQLQKDAFIKLDKVEECLGKYKKLCPPESYESRLQGQILEFDLRNLRQILEKQFSVSRLLPTEVSDEKKSSFQNLNQGRRNERNRSLPHGEKAVEQSEAQKAYYTKEQSLSNDLELKKMILQLGKDKKQLERKCEDRKVSLKKLYFIVTEKDKQLRKACSALEYCGN